jgi:hypothetical protein
MGDDTRRYSAFLSYAHTDERWAKWLHRAIETYRLDRGFAGRVTPLGTVPKTLRPIFRDRDDFSGGRTLDAATLAAIDNSGALVVLCSRVAAGRSAVNEEVRLFRIRHPARPVIPVLIDGSAPDNFPPALRYEIASDGSVSDQPVMILGVDLRENADGRLLGLAKIVSGLTGVPPGDLFRVADLDRRRAQRRTVALLATTATVFAGLAIAADYFRRDAIAERDAAQRNFALAKGAADSIIFDFVEGLKDTQGLTVPIAHRMLDRVETTINTLITKSGDTPELLYSQTAMLSEFVQIYRRLGDQASSAAAAAKELATAELLSQKDDRLGDIHRAYWLALMDNAEINNDIGQPKEALRYEQDAVTTAEILFSAAPPQNTAAKADLVKSYNAIATTLQSMGRRGEADAYFAKERELGVSPTSGDQRLAKAAPIAQTVDGALTLTAKGGQLASQGDWRGALEAYN